MGDAGQLMSRYNAFGTHSSEPAPEPEQPQHKTDLSAVPDAMWRAAGIDPACLPKGSKPGTEVRNRTKDLEDNERLRDDEWDGPVADLCATWKQNHIGRRSHRETLDNCLWLIRHGIGWSFLPPDRDSPSALRQKANSWAASGRFHALLEIAETVGTWRPSSLAALRAIVAWSDRRSERVEQKRAAVRAQARRRAVTA